MKCKLKDDAIIEFLKSNIEIEWDDIIDYLDENHLYSSDKEAILKAINYDEEESIDFDDVMNYIEHNRLSSSEEEQIKDYFADETFKINTLEDELKVDVLRNLYNNMTLQELEKIETFKINTLEDELKVDVLRNLYNNMTLQELEKIEKSITIKVI